MEQPPASPPDTQDSPAVSQEEEQEPKLSELPKQEGMSPEVVRIFFTALGMIAEIPEPDDIDEAQRLSVLNGQANVKAVAERIRSGKVKNVVVMTGAGLSVAAGIPDFRSPGAGLYSQLQKYNLPRPEDIFTLSYYKKKPEPFCKLAQEIFPGKYHPTRAHFLAPLLAQKGLLLRHYTQNIDNLDAIAHQTAGSDLENLIEAHGSFRDVHCTNCSKQHPLRWLRAHVMREMVPRCDTMVPPPPPPSESHFSYESDGEEGQQQQEEEDDQMEGEGDPVSTDAHTQQSGGGDAPMPVGGGSPDVPPQQQNQEQEQEGGVEEVHEETGEAVQGGDGKATAAGETKMVPCNGPVKPDIVFFGEPVPKKFTDEMNSETVAASADLLLILGTSLEVMPFASLLGKVSPLCPRVLINKTPVAINGHEDTHWQHGNSGFRFHSPDNYRDVFLQGTTDDGVTQLCRELGWTEELNALIAKYNAEMGEGVGWESLEQAQGIDEAAIEAAMQNAPPPVEEPEDVDEGGPPRPLPIPPREPTSQIPPMMKINIGMRAPAGPPSTNGTTAAAAAVRSESLQQPAGSVSENADSNSSPSGGDMMEDQN
uniref:Deacetylase sirtuin-type domain-containing protein n=1 Tax=Chromera velia CCMP2878 TaxID=1169474 RepID=A0A0G4HJ15_9ALVE|eukprot:Cvel_7063.t1-p1 / transcript=Cvel_7063.t1 / gene=Cvel_7063 / organism=Chromera_velia_CCMP2878 / gene_product=NAD-dependent protein deacetylase sirtuin-2, putative / transcript_product=NAD-dependent protein deacetylase sirtuin-2, putative / location=Cvel_scaffold361:41853-43791(-) / protein_length=593 / sequence_SO=supercontig / SO=protein_coding / is_pseudo=false